MKNNTLYNIAPPCRFLAVVGLLFVAMFLPVKTAFAETAKTEQARSFIDELGGTVLATVNSDTPEQEKQQQLQQLFIQNVDVDWMARFALGSSWTKATEAERQSYIAAYKKYLLRRYTTNFSEYTNSKYKIIGSKRISEGQYNVEMRIKAPNASDTDTKAGYRVRLDDSGQFKIVDIIVEGVSMITTQRSEFTAIAKKDGVNGLSKMLTNKK